MVVRQHPDFASSQAHSPTAISVMRSARSLDLSRKGCRGLLSAFAGMKVKRISDHFSRKPNPNSHSGRSRALGRAHGIGIGSFSRTLPTNAATGRTLRLLAAKAYTELAIPGWWPRMIRLPAVAADDINNGGKQRH